jgi:hypothetical protein
MRFHVLDLPLQFLGQKEVVSVQEGDIGSSSLVETQIPGRGGTFVLLPKAVDPVVSKKDAGSQRLRRAIIYDDDLKVV